MRTRTRRILTRTIAAVALGTAAIYFTGKTYVYRALYYNFAGIDDNKIFEERIISATNPQPWPVSEKYNQAKLPEAFLEKQQDLKMAAFLVVCHDSLRQEYYAGNYGPESLTNSFSVAKSVVSMLVGVALREGNIKSIDQPVGDFLPEFKEG